MLLLNVVLIFVCYIFEVGFIVIRVLDLLFFFLVFRCEVLVYFFVFFRMFFLLVFIIKDGRKIEKEFGFDFEVIIIDFVLFVYLSINFFINYRVFIYIFFYISIIIYGGRKWRY